MTLFFSQYRSEDTVIRGIILNWFEYIHDLCKEFYIWGVGGVPWAIFTSWNVLFMAVAVRLIIGHGRAYRHWLILLAHYDAGLFVVVLIVTAWISGKVVKWKLDIRHRTLDDNPNSDKLKPFLIQQLCKR